MDNRKEEIAAELENIDRVVRETAKIQDVARLSSLELSGSATLLHNFYNGAENVLKRLVLNRGLQLDEGPSWHRELLCLACKSGIISESLKGLLGEVSGIPPFFHPRLFPRFASRQNGNTCKGNVFCLSAIQSRNWFTAHLKIGRSTTEYSLIIIKLYLNKGKESIATQAGIKSISWEKYLLDGIQ
jgi:hypothetical protein